MNVRVIESSLEPLDGVGHERVLLENHQVSSERADSLGSHGVLRGKREEDASVIERERFELEKEGEKRRTRL